MVSRLFGSPPFIGHYQLKHKSSDQGQTNHLIESSYMSPILLTHFRPMYICTCKAKVKSGEGYTNKIARFELNKAYIKIRKPNLPCTDNTLFFGLFFIDF